MLRHCRRPKRKLKWTEAIFKAGKTAVLVAWRDDARHRAGENGDENVMRNPSKAVYGYDFWVRKSLLEVKSVAKDAFYSLRRVLYGLIFHSRRMLFSYFIMI